MHHIQNVGAQLPKQIGGNVVHFGGHQAQVLPHGLQQSQIGQQINSSLPNHGPRPTIINSANLPNQVRPQVIVPSSAGIPHSGQPQNLNATLQASQALILQQQQQLAAVQQQQLALQQQQQQQLMQQQQQTNDFDRRPSTDQKFSKPNEVNCLSLLLKSSIKLVSCHVFLLTLVLKWITLFTLFYIICYIFSMFTLLYSKICFVVILATKRAPCW